MPIQLSPGVNFSEIDLTTIVPSVAVSTGAFAGVFRWGPLEQRILVDSETSLVNKFAKPTNFNAETFFTASNFLSYTDSLLISRAANISGATPFGSFITTANSTVSNNIFVGNTTNLLAGMYVTQSSNASIVAPSNTMVISSINSSAIVLSSNSTSNLAVSLYFGNPGTSYTSIATDPNAVVANLVNQITKNDTHYSVKDGTYDSSVYYVAKYPGGIGNSLRIGVCDTAASFQSNVAVSANINFAIGSNVATVQFTGVSNASATSTVPLLTIGDKILSGNSSIGYQYVGVVSTSVNTNFSGSTLLSINLDQPYRLGTAYTSNTISRYWEFFNVTGSAPGQSRYVLLNGNTAAQDEMHVVVVDNGGLFTGTPGTVLESFSGLSRAIDAKKPDTTGNYYKDVINKSSAYIWWANDRAVATSANAAYVSSSTATAPGNYSLYLGTDGYDETTAPLSILSSAYDLFNSVETSDISLVLQGRPTGGTTVVNGITVSNFQLANYIIDNICAIRKDCVAWVSPDKSLTLNAYGTQASSLVAWRGAIHDSSYACMDTGYKQMYDRYNDLYRWVPLNGDCLGLCARTDHTNDAWWSPAGFNRGQIKNLVKLAWNPRKADRDVLYSSGINPIVTFSGQGTVLYGDKTLQSKPSAFDRINVRRLFIVLEKAISIAARYSLFEFNDSFTRSQFKNLVTPYLRTIQGRRGITDFLVVCDETNNTPFIIDSNQFVGDIYIKPARSISFIQLNFVAVGTGVQFSEVIGKF